jgi:hypothetical protein
MVTDALKNAFWAAVVDCLEQFYGFEHLQAVFSVSEFRSRIESPPEGLSGDIIYHSEPIHVAARLAGADLDFAEHNDAYEKILADRFDSISEREETPPVRLPVRAYG